MWDVGWYERARVSVCVRREAETGRGGGRHVRPVRLGDDLSHSAAGGGGHTVLNPLVGQRYRLNEVLRSIRPPNLPAGAAEGLSH